MKKTKTSKNPKKLPVKSAPRSKTLFGRHFKLWLTVLILAILAVGYQIVRANNDGGLALSTPIGSIQREAQLDNIELQTESKSDQAYDQQQSVNVLGDGTGLSQLSEVISSASQ